MYVNKSQNSNDLKSSIRQVINLYRTPEFTDNVQKEFTHCFGDCRATHSAPFEHLI